ncbi:hypothetical protein [Mycoplasmopsis sturni]|uniref:hypothetical protein n=1 Tax=Mycoplasmopsis sturni TaxID=39047 RepID=UPI0005623595|nr:hypothetical protein [Mycoplasmopsis sturni]
MKPNSYITKYHFWVLICSILAIVLFLGSLGISNNTKTYMILMDFPFLWVGFAISLLGVLSLKKTNPYLWTNFRLVVLSGFVNIILHALALGLFDQMNNSMWTFFIIALSSLQYLIIILLSATGRLRTTSYKKLDYFVTLL